MPKKMRKSNSTTMKKPSQGEAKPVVQQAKRVLKPGKFGKEIEDIFAARIKLRPRVQIPETNETKAEIAKKKRKRDRLERKNNPGSEPRRRQRMERTEVDNYPESEVRRQTTELDNNPEEKTKKKKRSGPRKITTDGLKVFREDEIGFNKAKSGGTRLCPFDCNCCF
ncbi:PREDICTED: uncharacterized protein C6G9.01c-like [Camelina sativa]|uniref:Uncharacterized protein C6G9.01c-like n=1 Tax=Camelina sativa TaxID=90675 RepID=A0ABM1QBP1_CAMSA|nr:PREDICTED: uncharacterized protein C6G9.01c-like [Camelina sativa]